MADASGRLKDWRGYAMAAWVWGIGFFYFYFHEGLKVFLLLALAAAGCCLVGWLTLRLWSRWMGGVARVRLVAVWAAVMAVEAAWVAVTKDFSSAAEYVRVGAAPIVINNFFILLLAVYFLAVGERCLRLFRWTAQDEGEKIFFALGLGMAVCHYAAFALTLMGWLYFWPVCALAAVFAVWARREMAGRVLAGWQAGWKIDAAQAKISVPNAVSAITLGVIAILGLLGTLRGFPADYDDLDIYFSVPRLYATYHQAVPLPNSPYAMAGGISMFWYAAMNTVWGERSVFTWNYLILGFVLFAVYRLGRSQFSRPAALWALMIALCIPLNIYFLITQKVDFLAAFYALAGAAAFVSWVKNHNHRYLYWAGGFLGFAVAVKLTALIYVVALSACLAVLWLRRKILIRQLVVTMAMCATAYAPIGFLQLALYQNPVAPMSVGSWFATRADFVSNPAVTVYDVFASPFGAERLSEYTRLTRQNSALFMPGLNWAWRLWNTTVNQRGLFLLYSQIGPFFLGLIPFALAWAWSDRGTSSRWLLGWWLAMFLAWYFLGNERPWYGLGMLYVGSVVAAAALTVVRSRRALFTIQFLIIIFLIRSIMFQTSIVINNTAISRESGPAAWAVTDYPRRQFYAYVNEEIIAKNPRAKILMVNDSAAAYINNFDRHVLADQLLLYWGRVRREAASLTDAKRMLMDQGITHVIFSQDRYRYLTAFDSGERYAILEDAAAFIEFRDRYLRQMRCEQGLCVYDFIQADAE